MPFWFSMLVIFLWRLHAFGDHVMATRASAKYRFYRLSTLADTACSLIESDHTARSAALVQERCLVLLIRGAALAGLGAVAHLVSRCMRVADAALDHAVLALFRAILVMLARLVASVTARASA
jgi:hypothetical protein